MDPAASDPRGSVLTDPDLGLAAALMNAQWSQPCWRYSETLLADYVRRPSGDRKLSVGWQRAGRLHGYFAGVPIVMRCGNARHKAIFTSFMTADPAAKNPGMALRLFGDVVARARELGAVHVYTVFHHDLATNRFVRRLFEMCAAKAQDLYEFTFLMRPLVVAAAPVEDADVVPYDPRWLAFATAAVARATAGVPLAQDLDAADFGAVLANPLTLARVILRSGEPRGLVVGRRRELLSMRATKHLHLDFVAIDGLDAREQDRLLAAYVGAAAAERHDALILPDLGYVDAAALKRNGFLRFSSQAILAVAPLVADAPAIPRVSGCFVEVY